MKALIRERYGPPDVLEVRDIERPAPMEREVLVRVHAASINDWDWQMLQSRLLADQARRPPLFLSHTTTSELSDFVERVTESDINGASSLVVPAYNWAGRRKVMKETKQKFTEAEAAVILSRLVRENPGARLVDTSTEKTVVSRHGRKIAKLISDGHGMWVNDIGNVTEIP